MCCRVSCRCRDKAHVADLVNEVRENLCGECHGGMRRGHDRSVRREKIKRLVCVCGVGLNVTEMVLEDSEIALSIFQSSFFFLRSI